MFCFRRNFSTKVDSMMIIFTQTCKHVLAQFSAHRLREKELASDWLTDKKWSVYD